MEVNRKHFFIVAAVSVLSKIGFMMFSLFVLFQGWDDIDLLYYYSHGSLLLAGQIPYINFGFDYPPMIFIPILIAQLLTPSFEVFWSAFVSILILCDLVTALCVYLIALEVFNSEKLALRAAIIYATALEICYFTFTKFDAFPTMIFMLALLFTIYGYKLRGYYTLIAGVLTKIFPLIAFPFIFIYNAKKSSLLKEFWSIYWPVIIPSACLGFIGLIILAIGSGSGSWARGTVYVNTIDYTIYAFLHDFLRLSWVPLHGIVLAGYILLGAIFLALPLYLYLSPDSPKILLKVILVAIFSFVMLWSYHSPQYLFWYIPILAILVAEDIYNIFLFYLVQVLAFIEFPQMPGYLYTNTEYLFTLAEAPGSWYLTWGFFVVFQTSLVYLVYRATAMNLRDVFIRLFGNWWL